MKKISVITGASSGFGALAAWTLARASHTVYASMRETTGRNAPQVKGVEQYAASRKLDHDACVTCLGSHDPRVHTRPGCEGSHHLPIAGTQTLLRREAG
jgi:NAD(P)-dependent dehydrogenase (short-subunit alcohol dehydrogenase family)